MNVLAQVRYLDYSARSVYAKNKRRADDDENALIRKVGERSDEERRRGASQRRPGSGLTRDEEATDGVVRPFTAAVRRDLLAEPARTTAETSALWSLIGAVEAEGTSEAPAEPTATLEVVEPVPPPASQAESLYLLLAQVISED